MKYGATIISIGNSYEQESAKIVAAQQWDTIMANKNNLYSSLITVSKWSGEWLNITAVERTTSGAYLCIASNGVPPSVSKRIQINVMCKTFLYCPTYLFKSLNDTATIKG